MNVPAPNTGPTFGPLAQQSSPFIPQLVLPQAVHETVIPRTLLNDAARSSYDVYDATRSADGVIGHVSSSDWRFTTGSSSHQGSTSMMASSEGQLPFSQSSTNRVLLNRNEAARHALKAQNSDIDREFERTMAAHAAQQRLLLAELQTLQQSATSTTHVGTGTATAVDLSTIASSSNGDPQHHHLPHQPVSNGKYFVSPFNRHKSRVRAVDPASAVSLPPPSNASVSQLHYAGSRKDVSSPSFGSAGVADTLSGNVATTTVATTRGLYVETTASTSPSLKLRQTTSGGLKLSPVSTSQVTSALNTMKTQGGHPVRVKVQLKVKLPPLKHGQSPTLPATAQFDAADASEKKQLIRLKSSSTVPGSNEETSNFASLRKIDILFAGERAASKRALESIGDAAIAEPPAASKENTLVLRCSDGTLCKVPVGNNRRFKYQTMMSSPKDLHDDQNGHGHSKAMQERGLPSGYFKGQRYLKSCLKKSIRSRPSRLRKKRVRFAPDTVEVNRESKVTGSYQPTVRIGSQLYKLKLPSIKSVRRVDASTSQATPTATVSNRYTVKAVSIRPKNKLDFAKLKKEDLLECIEETEEDVMVAPVNDDDTPSTGTPSPPAHRPVSPTPNTDCQPLQYTDMVISVAMKRKKSTAMDTKTPATSPAFQTPSPAYGSDHTGVAITRAAISPCAQSPPNYVVSQVEDKWRITIKNSGK